MSPKRISCRDTPSTERGCGLQSSTVTSLPGTTWRLTPPSRVPGCGRPSRGIPKNVRWRAPVRATESDLERVHDPRYIRWVRKMATGTCFLDVNTYVTCHSFDAASYAAGSTFAAVERTLDGEHLFALVRPPPGHHAEPDRAMGFCIFNNAAVAAAKALSSVDRVAILDWDLHHGNGTQTAFYGSDRVLYCSVHEENSFPKTGWVDEIGTGAGRGGYTLNAPACGRLDHRRLRARLRRSLRPGNHPVPSRRPDRLGRAGRPRRRRARPDEPRTRRLRRACRDADRRHGSPPLR